MNETTLENRPKHGIVYGLEPDLTAAEFIEILRASTLAERRPVEDLPRIGLSRHDSCWVS